MTSSTVAARLAVTAASLVLLVGCTAAATPSPSPAQVEPSVSPSPSPIGSTSPSPAPSAAVSIEPSRAPGTPEPPVSPSTPPSTTGGAWIVTGNMFSPHGYHSATSLPGGRVLVTGGLVEDRLDGRVSRTAELFDPSSGKWIPTGGMFDGRWGHTATLLPDGNVLVAGSYVDSGDPLASAELYDPGTGRWTATGSMNRGRGGHTATLLLDGTVLVVGGGAEDTLMEGGPYSASAELYDPGTGRWTATGSMVQVRRGFTATLLRDGRVLVAGGDGSFTAAELYDPSTGRWTATGDMAEGRIGHTATLLPDGTVLISGGCACSTPDDGARASAEVYDPATGEWTAAGRMGTARIFHTATLLPDGTVLVVDDGLGHRPASAELYDPSSGTWTATASPALTRFGYAATLLLDGRVLVTGDYGNNSRTAELYDPGAGS